MECYWNLDAKTDIDDPVNQKVKDSDECRDEQGFDRLPRKSLQSLDSDVSLVAPDLFDFYGDKNQRISPPLNEYNFFLFSRDRAPYCAEHSWLSVNSSQCTMAQASQLIHSDANDATNFKFTLNEDLGQLCYFW